MAHSLTLILFSCEINKNLSMNVGPPAALYSSKTNVIPLRLVLLKRIYVHFPTISNNVYLPIQKSLKTKSRTSSVCTAPVISPSDRPACLNLSAASTTSLPSNARHSANKETQQARWWACRGWVKLDTWSSGSPHLRKSENWFFSYNHFQTNVQKPIVKIISLREICWMTEKNIM